MSKSKARRAFRARKEERGFTNNYFTASSLSERFHVHPIREPTDSVTGEGVSAFKVRRG